MAGAMLEKDHLARQLRTEGLVDAVQIERQEKGRVESRSPFDPASLKLSPNFRLTKYTELRGRASKMPTVVIEKMLEGLQDENTRPRGEGEVPAKGLGMDAMICPIRLGGLSCIQTTHTSYPLVSDPWVQGKISASAVLSSMFAVGVTSIDNVMMVLTVSTKMTDAERDVVIPIILKGFREGAAEAGTSVSGGQSAINPWLTIGGVATSVCSPSEYIVPDSALVGDVLVLTKPLGTQVAINSFHWLENVDRWSKLKLIVSEEEVRKAHDRALDVMSRLNRSAAILMHKYNAHGATNIGSFGLLGHASALARNQKNEVNFVIHNLPVIAKMGAVAKACGNMFSLFKGEACETSGGLLVCLPREQAAAYCKDIEKMEGSQAWIIGIVEKGNRTARIIEKPRVIEVPSKEREGELW